MIFFSLRQRLFKKYTELKIQNPALSYLFFEITRRCNLNCIHCGSDCSRDSQSAELTTDSWYSIIDYIKGAFSPLPLIVLTGGEPLVHPDILELAEHLGSAGFPWGMVTNGLFLSQEILEKLMARGMRSITLSFDGDKESVSYIRNSANGFEKIYEALKIIGASSLEYKDAVTCVYPGNLGKLTWIADEVLACGLNNLRLFRIFPKGRSRENKGLLLDHQQTDEMLHWLKTNRKKYLKRGLNCSYSCEAYLPFQLDLQVRSEPFFCHAGINIASILCDGYITGCSNNGPDFYQGNILDHDFVDIWINRFTDYREKEWMKTGICEDCKEWDFCRGGSIHLRSKANPDPDFCYFNQS